MASAIVLALAGWVMAPPAWSQSAVKPADAVADGDWMYRVQPGDTLIALTAAYLKPGMGWQPLQRLNQVADPYRLPPGRMLRMPIAWLRAEAAVAEVLHVHGQAQRLAHGGEGTTLTVGEQLRTGDSVRTGAQSSVSLRFVDGARVLVAPDSQIKLERLLRMGASGMADTRLRLERGSADSMVPPAARPPGGYRIDTPSINLGVRGTEFRVRHAEAVSHAEVLTGLVDAGAAVGAAQRVAAGFGTRAAQGAAVAPPRALLPAPDLAALPARLERIPLQASWQAMPGVARYRAQVYADGPSEVLVLDGLFAEPVARWPDLPDGRYRMRVRGVDADGIEGRDAHAAFVMKARPEPPFTREPQPGRRVYGDKVQFEWTRPTGAGSYRLQVSTHPDFASLSADVGALADTRHALELPPGRYLWRLASVAGADDQGPFGDPRAFEIQLPPATPAAEPPRLSDKGLVFRWQSGPTGRYEVQVARDPAFNHVVASQTTDDVEFAVPDPQSGSYYMRVRALADDGFAGAWGATQQIEVPSRLWWLLVPLILILL